MLIRGWLELFAALGSVITGTLGVLLPLAAADVLALVLAAVALGMLLQRRFPDPH